jgi:glutamate-1-semialdehyde 2,1-aminomutase
MAAAKATLLEVLTADAYRRLDEINEILVRGCQEVAERYRLPAYAVGMGAKGSVIYSRTRLREFRDVIGIDERISYLAWLWQLRRGVFKSPWAKYETWTTSVAHSDRDARRYVENFEELAAALTS